MITELSNGIDLLLCEPGPFLSDRCAVRVVTKVKKENIVSKSISYRNFKDKDNFEFSKDLCNMTIVSDSVDNFVDQFECKIEQLLDKHAPMIEKTQIC